MVSVGLHAQILNSDFEAGVTANCACASNFTCQNDAGRVEDGFHPVWSTGTLGCVVGTTNYASPLGAHSGVGYIYFYAGADQIQTTPAQIFAGGEQIELCVWYSGPPAPATPGQDTPASHFKLGVDGVQVGPNVPVPTGTGWTQHCFTVTMTPGPHVFNILSGNAAQYTIWFDDFSSEDVNDPCDPVVITGDTVFCEGGMVLLQAMSTSATDYLWSTNEITSTITVTDPGTYWVQITDTCGTSTDTVEVSVVGYLDLELGNDTVLCTGDDLLLDATSPGGSYTWIDGSTDPTLLVNTPGYYSVELVNACGWSYDDITVDFVDPPILDLGPDQILCEGSGVLLDATSVGATYLWNNGTTDATVYADLEGDWWVEVTAGCGTITDTVAITVVTNVEPDLGNDTTLCAGDSLLLEATSVGATYSWQDGSTDSTFLAMDAGYYFVITDNVCGSFFSDIQIDPIDLPMIDLGPDQSACAGSSVLLDATSPGATYLWSDGSTDATVQVDASGTWWVQASTGCGTVSDTINVQILPSPTVDLGSDTTICAGPGFLLDASFPGATYLWQDGSTSAVYNVTNAGTYSVTVTTPCGAVADNILVGITDLPLVDLGPDLSLCPGATVLLDATSPGASYYWSNGSTLPTLTVSQTGNYTVQVSVPCGSVMSSVMVTYDPVPSVQLGNDTILCEGTTLDLSLAVPSASYLWQDGSTGASFTVTQAGTYWVNATNPCGQAADSINVDFIPVPELFLGNDTTLCEGETLDLGEVVTGATYLWNTGSIEPMITVADTGWYWLRLSVSCATMEDSIRVDVLPTPRITLPRDTVLCDSPNLLLDATFEEASYEWQDGSTEPTYYVESPGPYHVTVTNRCGRDMHSLVISTIDCSCAIFVPNAFTPNKDGDNDRFQPLFECELEKYELHIFNRWGELLITIKEPGMGWDGTVGGTLSQDGVYVYKVDYKSVDQGIKHLFGHVTLLR